MKIALKCTNDRIQRYIRYSLPLGSAGSQGDHVATSLSGGFSVGLRSSLYYNSATTLSGLEKCVRWR